MMGFPIRKATNTARERVYTDMEMWTEVRRRVLNKELSKRAACKEYSIHWDTLTRILEHVEPPGYQQAQPRPKPKIGPFLPIIHKILEDDRQAPRKQRHTAKRIFDRLAVEHQFDGGYTIVKDAVRAWKQQSKEVFLPLSHPMGEAQVDFGLAQIDLDGLREKVALFVMTLPYSDALFIQVFPRECSRSRKATGEHLSSSAACRDGSATTTARLPWPRFSARASAR